MQIAEVDARNSARQVAEEEESWRWYYTYLDDGIEDEESPVDDLRRPKRDEMSQVDTVNYEDLG